MSTREGARGGLLRETDGRLEPTVMVLSEAALGLSDDMQFCSAMLSELVEGDTGVAGEEGDVVRGVLLFLTHGFSGGANGMVYGVNAGMDISQCLGAQTPTRIRHAANSRLALKIAISNNRETGN